jgi:hypothetical protein
VDTERLNNVKQGLKETGQDVWGAIKGAATSLDPTALSGLWSHLYPGEDQLAEGIHQTVPALHAYENARSQGKSVIESVKAANAEMMRQQQATSMLKQRIDEFKKNPQIATIHAVGDAAALAATIYAGKAIEGFANPETEAAGVTPKQGLLDRAKTFYQQAKQGESIAQPEIQEAVRTGNAQSIETTNANAVKNGITEPVAAPEQPAASGPPVDKYPVSIKYDADGDIVDLDGRHRVVEAWERGDKTIPVTTQLRDGSIEVLDTPVQSAAEKMGLGKDLDHAKEILENTDANQPYRAGGGKPRPPVLEAPTTPKTSTGGVAVGKPTPPVEKPEATEPLTKNAKDTIVDDHVDALERQKRSAYGKMDQVAGFDYKALKDKLGVDEYNLRQLGSADPDKAGRLVEAINDAKDRLEEADLKMRKTGIDPDTADTLNARWRDGQEIRKGLLRAKTPEGEYDVNKMLTDARVLRNTKYGDRLARWFGSKDAADAYVQALEKAHASGIQAMKTQQFAKSVMHKAAAAVLGAGVVGTAAGAYEAMK